MAVFSAAAMLFVLDLARRFVGEPPQVLRTTALVLLFAQPYLTLRLVHRVRPGPRWLQVVALMAFVVSVVPVVESRVLSLPELVGMLSVFVAVQTTAAVLLAREAGARTGSPRARFATAAVSTALFGLGILAANVEVDQVQQRLLPPSVEQGQRVQAPVHRDDEREPLCGAVQP
jgi:hypothetical protein